GLPRISSQIEQRRRAIGAQCRRRRDGSPLLNDCATIHRSYRRHGFSLSFTRQTAMIGFELNEEHRLLEQSVQEWAGREVGPRIGELDRAHTFDPKILPQMAELGLLGVCVPSEYGGAGMDYISLGLASEELEYVDTSLRVILSVHVGLNCLSLLT